MPPFWRPTASNGGEPFPRLQQHLFPSKASVYAQPGAPLGQRRPPLPSAAPAPPRPPRPPQQGGLHPCLRFRLPAGLLLQLASTRPTPTLTFKHPCTHLHTHSLAHPLSHIFTNSYLYAFIHSKLPHTLPCTHSHVHAHTCTHSLTHHPLPPWGTPSLLDPGLLPSVVLEPPSQPPCCRLLLLCSSPSTRCFQQTSASHRQLLLPPNAAMP